MVIFYNVLPCVNYFDEGGVGDYKKECFHRFAVKALLSFIIVFRLVRDVVANHKTTRYAGAATKVIQKNHLT